MWLVRTYVIRHGEKFKAREFLPLFKEIPKTLGLLGDHPYITSAKDRVGGSRKLIVLLTFSTVFYADLTP